MSDKVHVKICGVTCVEDAEVCLSAGASSIGINMVASSPRVVDVETAQKIAGYVGDRAVSVLVVADLSVEQLRALKVATGAKCFQLHGDEVPATVEAMLPHAYKAVRVGDAADAARALGYPGEFLLVDAKVAGQLGGTGKVVDWDLVKPLARARKLTLAGGLTPDNVAAAIVAVRPFCVDVASGVERRGEPRRKDAGLVARFVEAVRGAG